MARVNDIRYVGYGIQNIDEEARFYTEAWKLEVVATEQDVVYLTAPGSHQGYSVRLRKSEEPRIDVISWSAEDRDAVDRLAEQVAEAGGQIVSKPAELMSFGGGYGFRFYDPAGFTIEVCCDFDTREPEEIQPGEARPEKISHVVLHAPDQKAYAAFYEQALGFKLSDWLGDFMCFLRCNEWHHRLAILPGPPTFNHVAYDVPDIDAVMKGISRVREYSSSSDVLWGPGRHTAGNNVFAYFATPAGYVVEYTSDLEAVDDDTWVATTYAPSKELMDQWQYGVGGPQTMPAPVPNAGLFNASEV
jgi:catechol 2,3-dioxygenase-like lactoylglutathione lyase family enzyme